MGEQSKSFPPTPPSAIVTFDFEDFADGTGVVILYGVIQETSAGTTYALTKSTAPSRGIDSARRLSNSATFTFNLTPFNTKRTIKGTATLIAQLFRTSGTLDFTVTIQHVDGVTSDVTDISSTITSATATPNDYIYNTSIPLTEKLFARGDNLRMKLIIGGSGDNDLECDPSGEISTPLQLLMPFKIKN